LDLDKMKIGSFGSFYFLFTIVMKVLISCTEKPIFFIGVLDESELFIDKKVIFDEKNFFQSAVRSRIKFCRILWSSPYHMIFWIFFISKIVLIEWFEVEPSENLMQCCKQKVFLRLCDTLVFCATLRENF
jgi:hypothetical protein